MPDNSDLSQHLNSPQPTQPVQAEHSADDGTINNAVNNTVDGIVDNTSTVDGTSSNTSDGKGSSETSSEGVGYVVGVGSSAGGLEALSEFINNLPDKLEDVAIVIAQHLSPTYKSMLVELLGRETQHTVNEVKEQQKICAGVIYVTPPDSNIELQADTLVLSKPNDSLGPKPSVNQFFESLALARGARAAGIILSGTGSDGARGLKTIHETGGLTLVQVPQTAKYDGMPQAAINTGSVTAMLRPKEMGEQLLELLQHPPQFTHAHNSFNELLALLADKTGTNFGHYKMSTIFRRLEKRLAALNIASIDHYLSYVRDTPDEIDVLFNTVLIGVTSFYRDPDAFDALKSYLRELINAKPVGDTLRIWTAGCASGEEAYTITMMVYDLLGQRTQDLDVQVFATDIDKRALAHARRGIYSAEQLHTMPESYLERFFTETSQGFEVSAAVRAKVLFSKHDVTSNPPFLRIDLISCRNLLIYFDSQLQKHVIPVFHYALNPQGYLFLGRSETIGAFSDLFATTDSKSKIYRRRSANSLHAIKFSAFKSQRTPRPLPPVQYEKSVAELVQETLYQTFAHPYVIINDNLDVLEIRGEITPYLSLREGTVNVNIVKLAREDLRIELRAVILRSLKSHRLERTSVRYLNDAPHYVDIVVRLLVTSEQRDNLLMVVFERRDIEGPVVVTSSDGTAKDTLELEQELAATKEHLQTFIEELETSNEELQSLNEELQSSNEELQTANEELETSNEELQSSNEELQMAYDELRSVNNALERKEAELSESEANVRALLGNTLQAFVLVSRTYHVLAFNARMQAWVKLFKPAPEISAEQVHTSSQDGSADDVSPADVLYEGDTIFDILPDSYLKTFHQDFKKALSGQDVHGEVSLNTQQGKTRVYRYCYTPVTDATNTDNSTDNTRADATSTDGTGNVTSVSLALLDITAEKQALAELADRENLISTIFAVTDVGFCLTNQRGEFVKINEGYCRLYGYREDELLGQNFTMVLPEDQRDAAQQLHDDYLRGLTEESAGEWTVQRKNGDPMRVLVTVARMQSYNQWFKVTSVTNLTPHMEAEQALRRERNLLRAIMQTSIAAVIVLDADGYITYVNNYVQDIFARSKDALISTQVDATEWYLCDLNGQPLAPQALPFRQILDDASTVDDHQLLVCVPDRDPKVVAINGAPVLTADGNVSYGVFFIHDISDRKKTEQALQELNETLEQRVKTRTLELEDLNQQLHTEVLEGQAKERALAQSEHRYHLLAGNIPNSDMYLFDTNMRILLADGTATKKINLDLSHVAGQTLRDAFEPAIADVLEPLFAQALVGREASGELRYILPDPILPDPILLDQVSSDHALPNQNASDRDALDQSAPTSSVDAPTSPVAEPADLARYYSIRAVPIIDMRGNVEAGMVLLQDVTERKHIEQQIADSLSEKEVLLQEVHHRVKNNLQIISSLLSLQSKRVSDDKVLNVLQDSQERVQAMALVHERLYQSDDLGYIDFAAYLAELAASAQKMYRATHVELIFETEPIHLTVEQAIPCGLISTELLSNVFKYAFADNTPDHTRPRVWIRLLRDAVYAEQVVLSVRDNGIGFPEEFTLEHANSLGYRIVTLLSRQLDAELEVGNETDPPGACTRLSFRIDNQDDDLLDSSDIILE
jgi:PAS domain S-box-containing protein